MERMASQQIWHFAGRYCSSRSLGLDLLALARQAHIQQRRLKSTKTKAIQKQARNSSIQRDDPSRRPSVSQSVRTSSPSSTPKYVNPSSIHDGPDTTGVSKILQPIDLYKLSSSRSLMATTLASTVFFSGTAMITYQNYAAVAATQPFVYYFGSGLSILWAAVAGYCFYAPLRLVSKITLLPNKPKDQSSDQTENKLAITFQQVLPFVKYKPVIIAADNVGTSVALTNLREQLQEEQAQSQTSGPLKSYYRHFLKMFARSTMSYMTIGEKGIWKVDMDPKTSTIAGGNTLARIVRPRYFRPWWFPRLTA